jgi:PAS domain S-box-containing protein
MVSTRLNEDLIAQERWTRDVLKRMLIVLSIAVLVILAGIFAGLFEASGTIPVYVIWAFTAAAWWLADHERWQVARYFPPLICFFLAAFGSYASGIRTYLVLFYGLAIILAGFLSSNTGRFATVGTSTAAHFCLGYLHDGGWNLELLPPTIVVFFSLLGIALVEWYFDSQIQQLLRDRVLGERALREEIQCRWDAESARLEQEAQLRLSEEKFVKAFQISPDAININRLRDGVFLEINQGFSDLSGYSREDAVGKSSLELNIWADPGDRARLVHGLSECGEVTNLQATFLRKNGEIGIGLMSARMIEIDHEPCILSVTRDVSEIQKSADALRSAHLNLEHAYEATLQGWVKALELRERETANHSQRVINLTVLIAQAMGFSGEALTHLQRGALLHDIGKLGVPDNILLAPRPLTKNEWSIMRQHPRYAYNLLADIPYLRPALNIPFCHHERWDGSGYPRGLSGEEIPLEARIFSVVDVYDALLSTRPYRGAWSEAEACDYLKQQSGILFDPQVVEVFLTIVEGISLERKEVIESD